jgi:hypothetical protein
MHVEYEWASPKNKTRAVLVETLKNNRRAMEQWWQGT